MSLSRRKFMVAAASTAALAGIPVAGATSANAAASVTPAEALRRLERGNTRSVNGNFKSKNYSSLASTPAKGQKPFAAILTCGDSRTDPDFIFDMAPGNLFVVRNAGNVLESVGLGSLEFAAAVLGVSVIAVIGHTECGAVIATEGSVKTGEMPGPHLDSFVDLISPAVGSAYPPGIRRMTRLPRTRPYQARQIQSQSSTIANLTATGDVGIVSGVYGLASGRVTWLQT